MDATLRALNRFGLGARIGERDGIRDPKSWLRDQLEGQPPRVAAPAHASPQAIGDAVRGLRAMRQARPGERQDARRQLIEIAAEESRAVLTERVVTSRPFVERLVAFWSNHLCVSTAGKILVAPLAGSYEREAIRPHVLGRFEDMVLASARHPAMLAYLDGFQSLGPSSSAARLASRRAGSARGLNENYARELLELHTLGVDGGYTQQDVRELARVLTGWTIEGLVPSPRESAEVGTPDGGPLRFAFRERWHEPGTKTLLGAKYSEGGVTEGERAIRTLCRHPSTATFVSRKLVQHFVADEPPPACVERLSRTFLSTGGDLKALAHTLIDSPEAWAGDHRKFRTPQDWLVAVLRALGVPGAYDQIVAVLRQLRHPLWAPQAPRGFGDTMPEWADADSLMNRAELSRTIGRRLGRETVDPRRLVEVIDLPADDPLHAWLADRSVPGPDRVALAIAGPAFQWR